MRYSSALVLSTLAVGQAAAANIRHASFHARRAAEQKREADLEAVNWKDVSYDLSHVDWSSVFATPTPTPSPSPKPEPSKAEVKIEAASTTPAYTPAAKTSEAAKPSHTKSPGIGGLIGDLSKLADGVDNFLKKLNLAVPSNPVPTAGGGDTKIWAGDDSNWKTTFINDGDEDLVVVCWLHDDSFHGMSVNTYAAPLAMMLSSGSSQVVSFAPDASGACAPAYSSTGLTIAGQLKQTWFEFTFGGPVHAVGGFDVSHEVYAKGRAMTAKGSKCTSDASTCSFQCKDRNAESCGDAGSYELINCDASNGGGGGFNVAAGGTGGGCNMGGNSEHIKVTFH